MINFDDSTADISARQKLPRLAVVVDISVERTTGGELQLYRLLAAYPPERLLIICTAHKSSGQDADRLPGVRYETFEYHIPKIINIGRNPLRGPLTTTYVRIQLTKRILDRIGDFSPDAVLSVSSGLLWFAAAAAAKRLAVPLHLILHDDWLALQTGHHSSAVRRFALWACKQAMRPVYKNALSRLCISPAMENHYRDRFGTRGDILYPSRGDDSPEVRVRVKRDIGRPPVIAYLGTVHFTEGPGSRIKILRKAAEVVAEQGGHLDLYTHDPRERLERHGLRSPCVRFPGVLPTKMAAEQIGQTAHALLLNGSFDPNERDEVTTLFPSKLADYTAIGVPILVWGPAYSAAAQWAFENPAAAILVTSEDPASVRSAVARLVADSDYAVNLATAAINAGHRYFDLSAVREKLMSYLTRYPEYPSPQS